MTTGETTGRPAGVTARPARIQFATHTADDGLFGPTSVTWRIASLPAMGIAGYAAAVVHMLHPQVMHVIDQSSSFRRSPEKRGELTVLFGRTVTYGDRATAEHAAEVLARIHHNAQAVDPHTGESYRADRPDLALWVHNTIQWMALRACAAYGPALSAEDARRYLVEQVEMARLLNVPVDEVPVTPADLDDYVSGMTPKLAYGPDTVWFKHMTLVPITPWKPATYTPGLLAVAVASLMNEEQREMYGVNRPAWQFDVNRRVIKALLEADNRKIPVASRIRLERESVDREAFGASRQHHDG